MVLARIFQARDVKEERLRQPMLYPHCRFGLLTRTRKKPVMLEPIVNHGNSLSRQPKKLHDVPRGVLADGDDFVLPPRQAPNEHPPVEHSFPIIFIRHVKRSQIVNRCYHPQGPRPQQPAIARHMQHLKLILARQFRQLRLMHRIFFTGGLNAPTQ